MRISYSELLLLGDPVLGNIDRLLRRGGARVELMMDGRAWDNVDGTWARLVKGLRECGASLSVHPAAWDTNLTSETKAIRDATMRLHVDTIRFAAEIGAHQVVLHPGFSGSPAFDKAEARSRARAATEALIAVAKPLGIKLAFENVGYHGSSIYSFEEFSVALEGLDDTVGYLIDTGHAHINGWDIPKLIRRVSGRLYGLHIHDNDGLSDQHLPIYGGNIEWQGIFDAMKSAPEDCEFILEYAPGVPLERLSEGKSILEREVRP